MKNIRLKFTNREGLKLGARLALPLDGQIGAMAIFAHCFTCTKNLLAVRNISRAMTQNGLAVLLFDFTGLGESEGDFADTNFSSNVSDLVSAAAYLEEHYTAPQILIGHSLGGAAVIQAATLLPAVKAVVTIGAPADPPHVLRLLQEDLARIRQTGHATVDIGGRSFTIKKQFVEDLLNNPLEGVLNQLDKALLIMHSPQDKVVGIENAAQIYTQARHPKSFITLDGADHLLSNKDDSKYAGEMIAHWVARYVNMVERPGLKSEKQVVVRTGEEGYTTEIKAGGHSLIADEPLAMGGSDLGPTPYGLLLASIGACTGITLRMYADRKKWPLTEVLVHLEHHKKHLEDCQTCEDPQSRVDHIDKEIELRGDLNEEQKERLLQIADRCPVHRTLQSKIVINTRLIESKPL